MWSISAAKAIAVHAARVWFPARLTGYCGSCRTRLVSGQVDWLTEPLAFIQPGEILPCCCRAKGDIEIEM
jgi:ferredoxin